MSDHSEIDRLRGALASRVEGLEPAQDLADRVIARRAAARRSSAVFGSSVIVTVAMLGVAGAITFSPRTQPQVDSPPAASSERATTSREPVPPGGLPGTLYYIHAMEPQSSTGSIYAKAGGGEPKVVASDVPLGNVTVSPDGQRIAYIERQGTQTSVLKVRGLGGGPSREVPLDENSSELCDKPVWHHDSRHLLYQNTWKKAEALYGWTLLDVETGQSTPLSGWFGCHPSWAPDGSTIGWRDEKSVARAGVLTDGDGGNRRAIPMAQGQERACANPPFALSPGGTLALISTNPSGLNDSTVNGCGDGEWRDPGYGAIVRTDTGAPVPLPVEGYLRNAVFLRDGSLIALMSKQPDVVLMGPDLQIKATITLPQYPEGYVLLAFVPSGT